MDRISGTIYGYRARETPNCVMSHRGFEFQQALLVLRIVLGALEISASKRRDRLARLPEGKREEMPDVILDPSQHTRAPCCLSLDRRGSPTGRDRPGRRGIGRLGLTVLTMPDSHYQRFIFLNLRQTIDEEAPSFSISSSALLISVRNLWSPLRTIIASAASVPGKTPAN